VFEGDKEYIYGAKIVMFGGANLYLYVSQPLELLDSALNRMGVRTTLLVVFTFFLAFAVSSAVAGWLIKPISEMKDKARLLAKGDFAVDFHGRDYGKELVDLADSLNFARDELSKTDTMQKELIANVSHDFKTPLTMIKAYASMIVEISGNNPVKRNKHAGVIIEEADRLTSLASDVLDLSKIRSDIAQLQAESLDVSAYLGEILARFSYLKETQGYQFVVDVDEGLSTVAGKTSIGQALYNLIGNAVNYTGEDKTVYVSLKRLDENTFRFAVKDTGAGIKSEELGEIWDRYYRSSSAHKRPVSGTGLGLSIVKAILEKHGFLFGVESEEGKGSTFYVLFPLIKSVDNAEN
jgi:signal transduction histidine kinase